MYKKNNLFMNIKTILMKNRVYPVLEEEEGAEAVDRADNLEAMDNSRISLTTSNSVVCRACKVAETMAVIRNRAQEEIEDREALGRTKEAVVVVEAETGVEVEEDQGGLLATKGEVQ